MTEPILKVGIVSGTSLRIRFNTTFRGSDGTAVTGELTVNATPDEEDPLVFTPENPAEAWFELDDVAIGIDFHWQRRETQRFAGALILLRKPGCLTAVNAIAVEEYLKSVISSEMNASAGVELLKAHAVISRSWVFSQIGADGLATDTAAEDDRIDTPSERIQWYDHTQHELFDVCADDHCQRYQGLTRQTSPAVEQAVEQTRGQVLTSAEGEICDARFSKCCGGVFELFENCWAPVHHSYLEPRRDLPDEENFPDLTVERNAEEWILSSPHSFCNTSDRRILDRILNSYDREIPDFYRWKEEYTADEIADIVRRRSGIDFGRIINIIPEERGTSGRLYRITIAGTLHTMTIGKELEIRRILSNTHLRSSAFVVERRDIDADGVPARIILHGAGWGHGVGLCQIGAAVMAEKGHDYSEILLHYYPGSSIRPLY